MIELKDIRKSYFINKSEIKVLKGIDILFDKDEFVSILGPSGCGKTTLLNIIGGLDRYTSGDIIINNVSTKEYKDEDWDNYRNKEIGFIFQSYNLIPHQNVLKNVEMPLILAGVDKEECEKRALEALTKVGLADQAKKKPSQMSGGQCQRVAIARALVTNPTLILADEPTGALDSESSVQVMEILREISKDHLVIMVTHNDQLADTYSDRIIRAKDGVIVSDNRILEKKEVLQDEQKSKELSKSIGKKKDKKSHLNFFNAFKLSFSNLISKKVRTSLTAFAGAVGIIGIALVMSFSTGVSNYVSMIESSSLTMYPISIDNASLDITSLMQAFVGQNTDNREEYPTDKEVYVSNVFGNVMKEIANGFVSSNDLESLKKELDNDSDYLDDLGYIKYSYGTSIHAYSLNSKTNEYRKVEPFVENMKAYFESNEQFSSIASITEIVNSYASMLSSWDMLLPNRDLLNQQYDVIAGSWPKTEVYSEGGQLYADIVITVDSKNQIADYQQILLGLINQDKETFTGGFENNVYTFNDLLNREYKILTGSDYYYKNGDQWYSHNKSTTDKEIVDSNCCVIARISGIVRPKKGTTATSINGVIGYDSSFIEFLIDRATNSEVAIAQGEANYDVTELPDSKGMHHSISSETKKSLLSEMGCADLEKPTAIYIYANSFSNKQKIINYLDNYNLEHENSVIKYSDTLSSLMSYINRITNIVTFALIGFTSVSLIVSSIMIAVLIYTSVLERRKEIGVLRSVGARKMDITSIFISESGIIGLYSGVIGVLIAWLIDIPVNMILKPKIGIALAAVVPWQGLVLVGLSMVLSILAGFVPAMFAAKLDPAVALRTD